MIKRIICSLLIVTFSSGWVNVFADNGMGKSKLFNGFLWILRDKVYDSDERKIIDITTAPLKIPLLM